MTDRDEQLEAQLRARPLPGLSDEARRRLLADLASAATGDSEPPAVLPRRTIWSTIATHRYAAACALAVACVALIAGITLTIDPFSAARRSSCSNELSRLSTPPPNSLLKKGTGSEPTDANAAKNSGREVPVPFLQQAAKGQADDALARYQNALEIKPDDKEARSPLARLNRALSHVMQEEEAQSDLVRPNAISDLVRPNGTLSLVVEPDEAVKAEIRSRLAADATSGDAGRGLASEAAKPGSPDAPPDSTTELSAEPAAEYATLNARRIISTAKSGSFDAHLDIAFDLSTKKMVDEAAVIVVATFVDSTPAEPTRPGDSPESLWRFRVARVLKGKLDKEIVTIQHPGAPVGASVDEIAGKEWILLLSPKYMAGNHRFATLLTVKEEGNVRSMLEAKPSEP